MPSRHAPFPPLRPAASATGHSPSPDSTSGDSALRQRVFARDFQNIFTEICPYKKKFVPLPCYLTIAQESLFHGVMVSTRVFGSLSPRSNRSGTTEKRKSFAQIICTKLFLFSPHPGLRHTGSLKERQRLSPHTSRTAETACGRPARLTPYFIFSNDRQCLHHPFTVRLSFFHYFSGKGSEHDSHSECQAAPYPCVIVIG